MSNLSHIFKSIGNSFGSSSEKVSPPETLVLRIISSRYGIIVIRAEKTDTGRMIMEKALARTEDGMKNFDTMKLVRTKTRTRFGHLEELGAEKVGNKEEFLLLPCRAAVKTSIEDTIIAMPTPRQIAAKTANIRVASPQLPAFNIYAMLQEDDMRKAFVTLAQEASYVLGMTTHADKLIAYYRQRIHNYLKSHKNAKKVLIELGFSERRVDKAMVLKANNPRAALDWLIMTSNRTMHELNFNSPDSPRSSMASSDRRDSILSTTFESTGSTLERIEGLLEIVKFYAQKDELVYLENVYEMGRMGYNRDEAHEALRLTRNNVAAAVAFIHGDKNPSIMELRNGFSETSEVRKKFLESPQIQSSLSNPDAFLLFVGILDNPAQANSWDPFSNVGSLMTHIIVTYHEQKHISATNQFNESRIPISALSAPN